MSPFKFGWHEAVHCQSHSSSRRRAWHHWMEEQRRSGQGDSSLTSLHESPMSDPSLEDPPKVPLPGFGEITWSLIRGQPPQVTIECSSRADATWSLGRTCHDHVDINKNKLGWGHWHYICRHSDSLNGASSLGDILHDGWPQYAYTGGGAQGERCYQRCHQSMKGRWPP